MRIHCTDKIEIIFTIHFFRFVSYSTDLRIYYAYYETNYASIKSIIMLYVSCLAFSYVQRLILKQQLAYMPTEYLENVGPTFHKLTKTIENN